MVTANPLNSFFCDWPFYQGINDEETGYCRYFRPGLQGNHVLLGARYGRVKNILRWDPNSVVIARKKAFPPDALRLG
jgi:hypothetical protein